MRENTGNPKDYIVIDFLHLSYKTQYQYIGKERHLSTMNLDITLTNVTLHIPIIISQITSFKSTFGILNIDIFNTPPQVIHVCEEMFNLKKVMVEGHRDFRKPQRWLKADISSHKDVASLKDG